MVHSLPCLQRSTQNPLTATEKKRIRTETFLSDVAAYRQGQPANGTAPTPKTPSLVFFFVHGLYFVSPSSVSSKPSARSHTSAATTTQPKKTLNADWRSKIQSLQRAASPSHSKTTASAKGKKTVQGRPKDTKGKARKVDESENEGEDSVDDALRERRSGIEDEAVETFQRGVVGLDQVRWSPLSVLFVSVTLTSAGSSRLRYLMSTTIL